MKLSKTTNLDSMGISDLNFYCSRGISQTGELHRQQSHMFSVHKLLKADADVDSTQPTLEINLKVGFSMCD